MLQKNFISKWKRKLQKLFFCAVIIHDLRASFVIERFDFSTSLSTKGGFLFSP